MRRIGTLIQLQGNWRGRNKLWLNPDDPHTESQSTASITPVVLGKFLRFDYTWAYQDNPQEGVILFGYEAEENLVTAIWADSWHMGDQFMICHGTLRDNGAVDVSGSYAAAPGPDWGWRTLVKARNEILFSLLMYNITPQGEEQLAVEAVYHRAR